MTTFYRGLSLFRKATSLVSIAAPSPTPIVRLGSKQRHFSSSTAIMAPNKTALDFVDFVNASPTRESLGK
jgi:hypothetical protein